MITERCSGCGADSQVCGCLTPGDGGKYCAWCIEAVDRGWTARLFEGD